jgi:short-subunit dehydrogenase
MRSITSILGGGIGFEGETRAELKGAVAVVTGTSSGIGEATALALARRGSKLVLAARRKERLETLARTIQAKGGGSFVNNSMDEIERLVQVNELGVMLTTKAFLPMMLRQSRGHIVNVAAVNPGFVATEGFPMDGMDPRLVMPVRRAAKAIEKVLRSGRAPEISVPRWAAAMQIFRLVTPGPYRWGVRRIAGRADSSVRMKKQ